MMRRPSSALIWIGLGALAALGALVLARQQATARPEPLAAGTAAPRFALTASSGERVTFAPPVARPLVLAFVATGCGHCARTAPALVALARAGTTVIAIDAGAATTADRRAFARGALAGAVPFLADPGGGVSRRYRASATPTVYVVGADGRVAAAWVGEAQLGRFEAALTAARG